MARTKKTVPKSDKSTDSGYTRPRLRVACIRLDIKRTVDLTSELWARLEQWDNDHGPDEVAHDYIPSKEEAKHIMDPRNAALRKKMMKEARICWSGEDAEEEDTSTGEDDDIDADGDQDREQDGEQEIGLSDDRAYEPHQSTRRRLGTLTQATKKGGNIMSKDLGDGDAMETGVSGPGLPAKTRLNSRISGKHNPTARFRPFGQSDVYDGVALLAQPNYEEWSVSLAPSFTEYPMNAVLT
jgi:hypothetical protein